MSQKEKFATSMQEDVKLTDEEVALLVKDVDPGVTTRVDFLKSVLSNPTNKSSPWPASCLRRVEMMLIRMDFRSPVKSILGRA